MNTKITTLFDENGRVCSKCNEYKIWDCYYKHSWNRTWHISCCKKCQSLTIEISRRRKEYKYVDKDLLDIEKDYKSKENKILGQMKRVKPPEKEIEKETRSWSEVDKVPKPYWNDKTAIRSWENPHPFISTKIK